MKSFEMRKKIQTLGDLELKTLAYTTFGIGRRPEPPRARLARRMALEERLKRFGKMNRKLRRLIR